MAGRIATRREAAAAVPAPQPGSQWWEWRALVATAAMLAGAAPALAAAPTSPEGRPPAAPLAAAARPTIIDHAVVPAGGAHCPQCPSGRCRHSQGHSSGRGHHPDCRHAQCVPFCPVRPAEFGFYGTRWRRWPGQGVVPVSAEQAATPMMPPKSEVPGPDEESPQRPDDERAAAPADDAAENSPAPAARPTLPPEAPEPPVEPGAG